MLSTFLRQCLSIGEDDRPLDSWDWLVSAFPELTTGACHPLHMCVPRPGCSCLHSKHRLSRQSRLGFCFVKRPKFIVPVLVLVKGIKSNSSGLSGPGSLATASIRYRLTTWIKLTLWKRVTATTHQTQCNIYDTTALFPQDPTLQDDAMFLILKTNTQDWIWLWETAPEVFIVFNLSIIDSDVILPSFLANILL